MAQPDYLLVPVRTAVYGGLLAEAAACGVLARARNDAAGRWRANIARAEGEAVRQAVSLTAFYYVFPGLYGAFRALTERPVPYPLDVWPLGAERVSALPDGWAGVDVSFQCEQDGRAAQGRLGVPDEFYNAFRCAVARDLLMAHKKVLL